MSNENEEKETELRGTSAVNARVRLTPSGRKVEIIDGGNMNRYDCVIAIKTLKHKDYCCPICSHGETIKVKILREYKGNLRGTYFRAYLECSQKCLAVGLYEKTDKTTFLPSNDDIVFMALDQFDDLIEFTKDRVEFISV